LEIISLVNGENRVGSAQSSLGFCIPQFVCFVILVFNDIFVIKLSEYFNRWFVKTPAGYLQIKSLRKKTGIKFDDHSFTIILPNKKLHGSLYTLPVLATGKTVSDKYIYTTALKTSK
jgi:hypothetical protein